MKTYSYQITKYGYKVFCDGVCVRCEETIQRSGKRFNERDEINFERAAQAVISYLRLMDKYNMEVKK